MEGYDTTQEEIEQCLNCQQVSCNNCIDRRKTPRMLNGKPKYHFWTEEEKAFLLANVQNGVPYIASKLGIPIGSVKNKLWKMRGSVKK